MELHHLFSCCASRSGTYHRSAKNPRRRGAPFRLRGLLCTCSDAPRFRRYAWFLLADAELGDDRTVTLDVLGSQVVQHLAALTDHLEQAAAAVVVVDVHLQMLGELLDAGSQDRDLDLGEPVSVSWVRLASITAVFSSLRIMGKFHLSDILPGN